MRCRPGPIAPDEMFSLECHAVLNSNATPECLSANVCCPATSLNRLGQLLRQLLLRPPRCVAGADAARSLFPDAGRAGTGRRCRYMAAWAAAGADGGGG